MSRDEFVIGLEFAFGPFAHPDWREKLREAMLRFTDKASAETIRVRGRYVTNYHDYSAAEQADTTYLTDTQLRDFALFDSLHGGLERGTGLLWEERALEHVLEGKGDGWRDVEVCRTDLLQAFPSKINDSDALLMPLPAVLPDIGPVIDVAEALCRLAYGTASFDTQVFQNASGELIFRAPDGSELEVREDGHLPSHVEAYQASSRRLYEALRDGSLASYAERRDGKVVIVPRVYWNGVNPRLLHQIYRGLPPGMQGAGSPLLLSRKAFEQWRGDWVEGESSAQQHDQPNRAPSVKAGRPPSDDDILAKADEMKQRGLTGYEIASQMRLEAGFENVSTIAVRELIKGRWKAPGRPKNGA